MALVSITEGARLVGKSRRTLHNYISQGKLSKTIDEQGNPKLDTSELMRVFGNDLDVQVHNTSQSEKLQQFTMQNANIAHEKDIALAELKKENELLKEIIAEKERSNEDLRRTLLLIENKILVQDNSVNTPVKDSEITPVKKKWWQIFK